MKIRAIIVVIILVISIVISGCSCKKQKQLKEEFVDYKFIIGIKSDYKYKYGNFTIEDFNYENIDHFTYMSWYDNVNEGYMVIYLKKTGMDEIEKAMEHFEKIEFVSLCEKVAIVRKA